MGFGVQALGSRVSVSEFRVWIRGSWFRVYVSGFSFVGFRIMVYGLGFRVLRDRVRVEDRGGECG